MQAFQQLLRSVKIDTTGLRYVFAPSDSFVEELQQQDIDLFSLNENLRTEIIENHVSDERVRNGRLKMLSGKTFPVGNDMIDNVQMVEGTSEGEYKLFIIEGLLLRNPLQVKQLTPAPVRNLNQYDPEIDPVKQFENGRKDDKAFYDRVIATKRNGTRRLLYEDVLERHTGNSFPVKAGQVIRLEQRPRDHNGKFQIADLLFITPDLEQYSCHLSTTVMEGFNPQVYGSMWTQSGFFEKICTIVYDDYPYHLLVDDENGKKVHHMFLAAHCSPDLNQIAYDTDHVYSNSCHENFIQGFNRLPAIKAIRDPELRRETVQRLADHNDLNVFQPNQIIPDSKGNARAKMFLSPQDYPEYVGLEFYAEKDMYLVASNCPYADQTVPLKDADPNPIYISVYDTGIKPESTNMGLYQRGVWEKIVYDRYKSGEKELAIRDFVE